MIAELNDILLRALNKVIFEGSLGKEIFLQDDFSKQLLILLETKLQAKEILSVSEFEAFLENLECWFVNYLKEFNLKKKSLIYKANKKLENIAAQTIFECLKRMTQDERKHFTLKNQAFIDAVKVNDGTSVRLREHDVAFEFDLRKLTLPNQLKLA